MANRHLSRSIVLQALFEWDFNNYPQNIEVDLINRLIHEFAPGLADTNFSIELLKGITAKRQEIDEIISKAAPDWPIEKISPIDRAVLRLGLYELIFGDREHVPAKVAINEAIELAKSYGGEASGRFVNGVMGAVYKEMGEPGKDAEAPKRKQEVPYEKMPIQTLCGAVVYSENDGARYMAFVHDVFGHWTLTKGKVAQGIDPKKGTIDKVKEEIGLDVEIVSDLGVNEYIANEPEKGKIRKQVHYFLVKSKFTELTLAKKPGLDDAKWFKLADILDLNFYSDILPIVTKAVTTLSE